MKHLVLTKILGIGLFLAFSLPAFAQFPNLSGKLVQGKQTTALGITSYSDTVPLHTPTAASWRNNTQIHRDTALGVDYVWRYPRWYANSTVRQSSPPPATRAAGSNFVDYTETLWQNSTDSLTYYYEEKQQCWEPIGTVVRDTMPVSTSATGTSAAVCYEYSLWYNSTNDSLYAYTAGDWLAIGSGGGGTAGAVDSIVVLQDSIIVGYSEGVEVTRDTIGYPPTATGYSDWTAAADSGTPAVISDGETVTHAGGYGINTVISGNTITSTADTSELVTPSDISGLPSGTGTNQRIVVWTGTNSQGNSTQLQSAAGVTLDASLAFRITGGTTAARPTGAAGMQYYNTDNNWFDFYNGTSWFNPARSATTNGLFTAGSVLFAHSDGTIQQNNSNFFWNNSLIRLGLGTASPNQQLELTGNFRMPATTNASQNGIIYSGANRFMYTFTYGNNGTVTPTGQNIFIGMSSGNFTTGSTATASDQSSNNLGIGRSVMPSITTGYENVFVGTFAGFSITTGQSNFGAGVSALELLTTGSFNLANGTKALGNITTASSNVGVGINAGRFIANGVTANQTSNTSLYIGGNTKALANGDANEIVIGYDATGLGSNTAVLGNSSVTTTALRGSVGISNTSPQRTLHVTGEARITDLTTDTPTGIVGADADGDLGLVALGAGLSIGSGTLSGAFLPLTLTGATEVNTAGQNLYFRDAAGYPFTFMNSNYFLAASGANNYIDVGSTASNVKVISDGLIELNSSVNTSLITTGRLLIDGDSTVIDATLPVNTNATHVLVRDAVTKRLEEKTVASFAATAPSEEILFGTGTGTDTDAGLKYQDDTGNRLTSANGKLDLNTISEPQVSTVAKFAEDRFFDIDPDFEPTNDSTVVGMVRLRHRGENGTGTRRPYLFNEGTPGTNTGGDFVFSVFHEGIKLWRRNNSIHNNVWGYLQPPNSRLDIGWTTGVSFASFYRTTDNVDTTKWFDFKSTGELFAHAYRVSGESQSTSFTGFATLDDLGNYQRTNTTTVKDSIFGTAITTATLDFGSTAAGTVSDLTVTVTGAAVGDIVTIGVPHGSVPAAGTFFAWVSATNTVTVRYSNNALVTAYDPASGDFRVRVEK